MASDDNTVNIARPRRYHHGDLRRALIAAALELLAEREVDDLGLREVARRVGVSATAVYRHFPDKQALLFALCAEGADMLAAQQRAAMMAVGATEPAAGDDPALIRAGFAATGRAYIHFALAHPALYRLMMSAHSPRPARTRDAARPLDAATELLRQNIAAMVPAAAGPGAVEAAMVQAWGLVHGTAMLMLDQLVPRDEAIIAAVCGAVPGEGTGPG